MSSVSVLQPNRKQKMHMVPKQIVTEAYATALQMCLIDCVKGLVEIGVDPAVRSVARQIWIRSLEVSKLLAPDAFSSALRKYRERMQDTKLGLDEERRMLEEAGDDMHSQEVYVWLSTLWGILDLQTVVWVCYAACVELREAITPVDMALWIKEGRLPFMNLERYGDEAMSKACIQYPKTLMRPWAPPRPASIAAGAFQLSRDIGLTIAPLNVPMLLLRTVHSLGMPEVVGETAVEVHRIFGCLTKKIGQGVFWERYMEIGAHVLVAAKYCYGLDGVDHTNHAREAVPPPPSWVQWARDAWNTVLSMHSAFDVSVLELDKLRRDDIQEVSMSCSTGTYAQCNPIPGFDDVQRRLERMCLRKNFLRDSQPRPEGFVSSEGWKYSLSDIRPRLKCVDCSGGEESQENISRMKLMFQTDDSHSYIPDVHLLPCETYWFVPSLDGLSGQNIHIPVEFAAVLALVSSFVGVMPRTLLACLYKIEKILWNTEAKMASRIEGKSYPQVHRNKRSLPMQMTMLHTALKEEGLSPEEINRILDDNLRNLGGQKRSTSVHFMNPALT